MTLSLTCLLCFAVEITIRIFLCVRKNWCSQVANLCNVVYNFSFIWNNVKKNTIITSNGDSDFLHSDNSTTLVYRGFSVDDNIEPKVCPIVLFHFVDKFQANDGEAFECLGEFIYHHRPLVLGLLLLGYWTPMQGVPRSDAPTQPKGQFL